jgi:CHAT domain-containing protein
MGEQACEATVQDLARSGRMKAFRYLHLAAHGESDPVRAYRTALILAPDPERPADPLALDSDGTITAEQIARTWELDAELVVLSACESGLGRSAGGEGYLGFAQPLLAKGARSLVLSQWKVDDDATALLMERFYQNLLGRRPGLAKPLAKAEALAEAKRWLRERTAEEIDDELARLTRGEIVKRQAVVPVSSLRRYEHPSFWAGFILIGDPD